MKNVDFEKELAKGRVSYDRAVGNWWIGRASDRAHKSAYRKIASSISQQHSQKNQQPRFIVDYACGNGEFLVAMVKQFPKSNFVALDGSVRMLAATANKLRDLKISSDLVKSSQIFKPKGPQVRLVETNLPNFSLPGGKADIITFVFPNITFSDEDQDYYDRHGYRNPKDAAIAEMLARFREMDPEDEIKEENPEENYDSLMTERVISRNLRNLLKQSGCLYRIEYGNAPREQLSQLTQWRSLFGEGALDVPIKEKTCSNFFRFDKSTFHRSSVILDVYHQTRDPDDKQGGYFITGFKAI